MITCKYPNWLDEEEVKLHIDSAKRAFKRHKAKVIVNDKRFLILDWANKDPMHGFEFHYVLDKELGTLVVYGDFMDGLAKWNHSVGLGDVVKCMCHKEQFVAALNKENMPIYEFSYRDAVKDLNAAKEKAIAKARKSKEELAVASASDDFDYMADMLDEYGPNAPFNGPFTGLWIKYNPEMPADMIGKRLIYPVYIWVLGFLLACDKANLITLM